MKIKLLSVILSVLVMACAEAQNPSPQAQKIKSVITKFMKAGDDNDAKTMNTLLDPNYRIVMNQLFGSKEVVILPRAAYIEKIKNKEFGGDKRQITFDNIVMNGNTAVAKVTASGNKGTMISLLALVQDTKGNWLLVSDTPVFTN